MKKVVALFITLGFALLFASVARAKDGDLDTTWNRTGLVSITQADSSSAFSIHPYPGNKVLAVGSLSESPVNQILVARFLTDGTPDETCHQTGQYLDSVNDAVASDVVVAPNGSFFITGTIQLSNAPTLFVAKFTATCSLDPDFGNAGFATYGSGAGTSGLSIVLQPDQKIVVSGFKSATDPDGGGNRLLIVRLTSAGLFDINFATSGVFTSSPAQQGQAQDLVLDATNGLIFVGSVSVDSPATEALVVGRLDRDGKLDTAFAVQGYRIGGPGGDSKLSAIDIRPNGNFVAVGTFSELTGGLRKSPMVACLTINGSFDPHCGSSGWRIFPDDGFDGTADDVLVTEDDSIIVSGEIHDSDAEPLKREPYVRRLSSAGLPDSAFAVAGRWLDPGFVGRLHAVNIQDDGRILAAGEIDQEDGIYFGIIRLNNTVVTTTTTTTTTTLALVAPPPIDLPESTTSTVADRSLLPPSTLAGESLPVTGNGSHPTDLALWCGLVGALVYLVRRRSIYNDRSSSQ